MSRHSKAAGALGVGSEMLALLCDGPKLWRNTSTDKAGRVEDAALAYYSEMGWFGSASEGGLVLNLIKAASFETLPIAHRNAFTEAIYAENIAFEELKVPVSVLLKTLSRCSAAQIQRNVSRMMDPSPSTYSLRGMKFTQQGCLLDYFPALRVEDFISFFLALGRERLYALGESFARDPYTFRRGWPDLTLWKPDGRVVFKEIKAPGDALHASQKQLYRDVLVPLGFEVSVVDVTIAGA